MSKAFQSFLMNQDIKPIATSAYNPTGNSISERLNQTITRVLQAQQQQPIRQVLKQINWVLQNQPRRDTRLSLYEIRYQRSAFDPCQRSLAQLVAKVPHMTAQACIREAARINRKRRPHLYKPGDIVYHDARPTGKLDPVWDGPFTVTEIKANGNVAIIQSPHQHLETNIKRIRPM